LPQAAHLPVFRVWAEAIGCRLEPIHFFESQIITTQKTYRSIMPTKSKFIDFKAVKAATRLSKFCFVKIHVFAQEGQQPEDMSAEDVKNIFGGFL
jgi:hypothetical protein